MELEGTIKAIAYDNKGILVTTPEGDKWINFERDSDKVWNFASKMNKGDKVNVKYRDPQKGERGKIITIYIKKIGKGETQDTGGYPEREERPYTRADKMPDKDDEDSKRKATRQSVFTGVCSAIAKLNRTYIDVPEMMADIKRMVNEGEKIINDLSNMEQDIG